MQIPKFIEELIENGIPVTMQKGGAFHIEGFYKSSGVSIEPYNGEYFARARYDEKTPVKSLEDLVSLNYYWWQRSKDRFEGWAQPEERWIPLLLRFGHIKEKTIPAKVIYE